MRENVLLESRLTTKTGKRIVLKSNLDGVITININGGADTEVKNIKKYIKANFTSLNEEDIHLILSFEVLKDQLTKIEKQRDKAILDLFK